MTTVEQHRSGPVAPSRSEIDAARALARQLGLEYVDLDRYPLNAAAARTLPEKIARNYHALAIGWKHGTPVVAVAAPNNVLAMDDIRAAAGRDIHAVVVCLSQVDDYIGRVYAETPVPGSSGLAHARAQQTEAVNGGEPHVPPQVESVIQGGESGPGTADAAATVDAQRSQVPPPVEAPPAEMPPVDDSPGHRAAAEARARETNTLEALLSEARGGAPAVGAPAVGSPAVGSPPGPAEEAERAPRPVHLLPDDALGDAPLEEVLKEVAMIAAEAAAPPEATPRSSEPAQKPALAEVLVTSGQVTHEEMQAALRESNATGRSLGVILNDLGLVSEEDVIHWMAEEAGLEFVDLNDFAIDSRAISLLPETMARRHQLLAIGFRDDHPIVAMANPSNVFALDDLRNMLGRDVETVVSSPRQITDYISRMYRHDKEAADAARSAVANQTAAEVSAANISITDLHAVVEDAPIIKYVNLILRQALQERASDVHVEPAADDLRVRFRIDGVLHDITRSPKSIQGGVTTRLKVMANLDIAEHRVPQDGRISITAGNREIDLRVATLPTVHGEKVVLRILDKTNAMMDLSDLGFLPEVDRRYQLAYRKPYGTILVTGPTGSGKSTTLYATLNALNSPERNLITVEDPVEYQLPGVNQVQVNPKAGLTFASALRSILRADPDIILVGEMRDKETAIMGVEAALTGHLVLSSLHTNDAAGTPMRLVEMGIEPFLVGSALDCIVAQRLARQLCDNCNEPHYPDAAELAAFGWDDDDAPQQNSPRFRRAIGCQACGRTGYRGRIALHELLIVSEEVTRAVVTGATTEEIHQIGVQQGTIPLRHDGLRKAALGLTSLEEVIRVVA